MRADSYLRLGAGMLGAGAVIRMTHWVFVAQMMGSPYKPTTIERLQSLDKVLLPLSLATTLVLGVALLLFARATHRSDLRMPAILAGVITLIVAAVSTLQWTREIWQVPEYLIRERKFWSWTVTIAMVAGPVALLGFCQRARRAMSSAALAFLGLGIAWTAGLPLWEVATDSLPAVNMVLFGHEFLWLLIVPGVAFATHLGLASALYRAADTAAYEQEDLYLGWPTVALGLRFYGNGLAWRISITFVGMFLLFMAAVSGSAGMTSLFGFLLPVALIITSLVMASGLAGYARQPAGSGGAAPAWIAFAALLLGVVFDLVAAIMIIRLVGGARIDFLDSELKELSARMTRWGLITGGVSLAAMLLSFGLVASHLRRADMVRKVIGLVASYVLTVAVIVAFSVYGPKVKDVATGLMLMLGLVILALILALAYLRLVRSMEVAIEAAGSGDGLPEARVVES